MTKLLYFKCSNCKSIYVKENSEVLIDLCYCKLVAILAANKTRNKNKTTFFFVCETDEKYYAKVFANKIVNIFKITTPFYSSYKKIHNN